MKKSIILFLFGILSASVSAEQNWGQYFIDNNPICVEFNLYGIGNGNSDHPGPHREPDYFPVLGYEGNTFVLAVPYELENVTIVIRDEDGIVLYYNTVSSITDYYMFQLSNDVIADMFSIELYYGDVHLYGEF